MTEAESSLAPSTRSVIPIENFIHQATGMNRPRLFSGLAQTAYYEIMSFARLRSFVRNEALFTQGQPIERFLLLQSGSVKVLQTSFQGAEVILAISGPGEAVLVPIGCQDRMHSCSAQALEECKALAWRLDQFQMLGARYPQLITNTGGILTGRLAEMEQRFREVAIENVETRLALAFLRLAPSVGKAHEPGVEVYLSIEELAQITASTRYTVSRILTRWEKSGLIFHKWRSIMIYDLSSFELFVAGSYKRKINRSADPNHP